MESFKISYSIGPTVEGPTVLCKIGFVGMVIDGAFQNGNKALPILSSSHIIHHKRDRYAHITWPLLNSAVYVD